MIAEELYNGAGQEELGLGEIEYQSRKETLERFLKENGPPQNFQQEYLAWLQKDQEQKTVLAEGEECCQEKTPTIRSMAKNLVKSAGEIKRSRFKLASQEEWDRRYGLCQTCSWFKHHRCMQCGCFMKVKSKFAAMKCPVGLW